MLFYIIIAISLAALVSTWALKYFEGRRSDEVDQFGSKGSHIWAKRSSSRRKAIYKKNSQLNDYLEKNLSKGGNSDNIQFQSNFPWKTYVQNSRYEGKIAGLDQIELKLYESIFEIILTEKSYLTQLEHLTSFALSHPELDLVISKYDRNLLFGNLHNLFSVNHEMYSDFETAFQSDIFMSKIFSILSKYLTDGSFQQYIDYIKSHQERNRLITDEANCQTVPDLVQLRSLIIVPMQRITRYPLLVQNIRGLTEKILSKFPNSPIAKTIDQSAIAQCLKDASEFAARCNKALDDEKKLFDLIQFKKQLTGSVTIDDLVSTNREILQRVLVKMYFLKQTAGSGTTSPPSAVPMPSSWSSSVFKSYSSMSKVKSTLILLTDMLIITEHKPKKNQYIVIDHDKLPQVQFERRRDSIVPNGSSSTESIEKINEEGGGSSKARCTVTMESSDNLYGITFLSLEEEEKFIKQLVNLKSQLTFNNK